jgi:DNA modification methylase
MKPTVQNDRTVSNNKPDSIICDNKQGTYMSIDVAIPADRNVIKKEAEMILKYKDLTIEIERVWNVKAKVIPIITGET